MARVTGTAENTMGKNHEIKQIYLKPKGTIAMVNAAKDIAYLGFPTQTKVGIYYSPPHCVPWPRWLW